MRYLEVRRHTMRTKPGEHLSQAGVVLARRVGHAMGPFDRVVTTLAPRAFETAIAMGFAVDEQLEVLGDIPHAVWDEIGHQERWEWDQPFVKFAQYVASGGPTARLGQRQRAAWLRALESVPDEGSALIISHGRVIEAGLVTCLPDGDFVAWGAPFEHGEGGQLSYHEGRFGNVKFRRNVDRE